MMKAYEEGSKKKSLGEMNMLGLDIRRIEYDPAAQARNSTRKINKNASYYSGAANSEPKQRQNSFQASESHIQLNSP